MDTHTTYIVGGGGGGVDLLEKKKEKNSSESSESSNSSSSLTNFNPNLNPNPNNNNNYYSTSPSPLLPNKGSNSTSTSLSISNKSKTKNNKRRRKKNKKRGLPPSLSPVRTPAPRGRPPKHGRPPLGSAKTPFVSTRVEDYAHFDETGERIIKKRKLKSLEDHPPPRLTLSRASSPISSPSGSLPTKISQVKESGDLKGVSTDTQTENGFTPGPSKQMLEGILDKLQKKDTYGVFSEPVDEEEVPGYYDVIQDPMDFGTIRKKLEEGAYTSWEIFEKDVFLICSNAMHYNAKSTVYYRQARAIQDLAYKTLESVKSSLIPTATEEEEAHVAEKQTTDVPVVKKLLKRSLQHGTTGSEVPDSHHISGCLPNTHTQSGVSLGKVNATEKCSNIVRNTGLGGVRSNITATYTDSPLEAKSDPQGDIASSYNAAKSLFPLRFEMFGENLRSSYRPREYLGQGDTFMNLPSSSEPQQIIPVGSQPDHAYARSLFQFSADLGPSVFKVALKKIQKTVSPGLPLDEKAIHLRLTSKDEPQPKAAEKSVNRGIDLNGEAPCLPRNEAHSKKPPSTSKSEVSKPPETMYTTSALREDPHSGSKLDQISLMNKQRDGFCESGNIGNGMNKAKQRQSELEEASRVSQVGSFPRQESAANVIRTMVGPSASRTIFRSQGQASQYNISTGLPNPETIHAFNNPQLLQQKGNLNQQWQFLQVPQVQHPPPFHHPRTSGIPISKPSLDPLPNDKTEPSHPDLALQL